MFTSPSSQKEVSCKFKTHPLLSKDFPEACNKFISPEDGSYGEYGNEINNYLTEQGDDSLFLKTDQSSTCPNWKNLTTDQKKHHWVWSMASIAKVESTCNPIAKNNQGTNGPAIGLLQLDSTASQLKWRGENCRSKTVTDPTQNLRCGLDIMGGLLKGKEGIYKSNGQISGNGSNSYWEELRKSDGGDIAQLISQNPECGI
jgi:hypothetical protein